MRGIVGRGDVVVFFGFLYEEDQLETYGNIVKIRRLICNILLVDIRYINVYMYI